MKPIHIFRAGKHRDSAGTEITFSDAELQAMVAAYDPAVHEAPIVVGHPKDNGPAYGWVGKLSMEGDGPHAHPRDLDKDFAELVQKRRYGKVSASFYTPDSPSNPKPGSYYLRHVGFLGAQPPAIKGLKPIEFVADEQGVVEFADTSYATGVMARVLRGLREWLIGEKGVETADSILPNFYITDLEAEANKPLSNPPPAFAEGSQENDVDATELKAAQTKLAADQAALATAQAALTTDRTALDSDRKNFNEERAGAAKAADEQGLTLFCENLVKAGKLTPAEVKPTVAMLMALPSAAPATAEFGEGSDKKPMSPRDYAKARLDAATKKVDFNEHTDGADPAGKSAQDYADKIRAVRAEAQQKGTTLSYAEAAERVRAAA